MNRKHLLTAIILNSVIIALVLVGFFFALFDVHLFGDIGKLTPSSSDMFSKFTVDSNLLLGIFAVPILIYQILVYMNKKDKVPHVLYVLKLTSNSNYYSN